MLICMPLIQIFILTPWEFRFSTKMSATEDLAQSTWDSTPTTTERRLSKWKKCLIFNIVSTDNTSAKAVGIVDGGSKFCLMSCHAARKAGLEIMPFKDGNRPVLEGFEDILKCQPVGWVLASIRQADLDLNTVRSWKFLVVITREIDLLLGYFFNHEHDIELKISQAVKLGLDPKECDDDRLPGHNILVLMDTRSKGEGLYT
ncbi:hypothetical protein F5Y13DRAFT_164657 [Hypoxylon sp. FL1857]|nr:hypothetical protein F5Y13DRAFT_164657 [Hypoxylon sp. FL1857]